MMEIERMVAIGCVLFIFLTMFASGPLVSGVDLTPKHEGQERWIGNGSINASVESLPNQATFEKGFYGSETYYLEVPDAVLRIDNLEGAPIVVYNIRIPELLYLSGKSYFPRKKDVGELNISIGREAFSPNKIQKESYKAELSVVVRIGESKRVLRSKNITVDVK